MRHRNRARPRDARDGATDAAPEPPRPLPLTAPRSVDHLVGMFEAARKRSMRVLAAALLALTTVLVGFAHRPLELETRGYGADAALYLMPDGTLPDLCLHDDAGDHDPANHRQGTTKSSCEACRLSGAPGLGAVAQALPVPPRMHVLAIVLPRAAALTGSLLPAPQSRGPPVIA